MTFRDDHDAALARADALEDEVARVKRERDELEAKVKALEVENAEVKVKADREERRAAKEKLKKQKLKEIEENKKKKERAGSEAGDKRAGIIAVVLTVLAIGPFAIWGVVSDCGHQRDRKEWDAKTAARKAYTERWRALVGVEACLRRVAYDAVMVRRNTPDKADPRKAHIWSFGSRLTGNCFDGTKKLIADPKTASPMRAALAAWHGIQNQLGEAGKPLDAYYSNGDWKEDNLAGAPALWAPVLALLERQVGAIAAVRRDALPAIREEIRGMQRAHEARGRDETWWRVELGIRIWEINDRSYEAAGIYAGREPDDAAASTAIRTLVTALLEATKQAPIEVRRIIRKLDHITAQIVAGGPLRGETPLWHLAGADDDLIGIAHHEVIPGLPPDPGPPPRDPD